MTWSSALQLGLLLGSAGLSHGALDGSRYLWFATPGVDWETSAQLIGNGRLGASIFGGGDEVITFSEDTIWDGPLQNRTVPQGLEYEPIVRAALLAGNITDGGNLAQEYMTPPQPSERQFSYFGSLNLDFGHTNGTLENYIRALDTRQGNLQVNYTYQGVNYTREYIANFPTGIFAARITASQKGALNFSSYFTRTQYILSNNASTAGGNKTLTLEGSSGQPAAQGPILYTGQARFLADCGAKFTASGSNLTVTGATTVDIFFDTETNVRYNTTNQAWVDVMNERLDAGQTKGFPAVKQEAIDDVSAILGRASIDLGSSPNGESNNPIDMRIHSSRQNLTDLELVTLTWNYGRHLLLASGRDQPTTFDFPPGLIGIWNNETSSSWGGKFTIDVNIEMNMWPADQTNIPEALDPLWELMNRANPRGAAQAQQLYGCPGTVFHHNLDVWGDPAPTDNYTSASVWPMGAAWLVTSLSDHYRFTGDKDFLQQKTYPLLVDIANFYYCYTFEWEGNNVTGPSLSPENEFVIFPNQTVAGQGAAMDIAPEFDNQLMRDVVSAIIEFAPDLGIADDDQDVINAKDFLPTIREPRIGSYGQILEWKWEYNETQPGMRHLSPLYGLHPSNQFEPLVNKTLFDAALVLLNRRVQYGSGSTGWSRTWMVNQYARALMPYNVWEHIQLWYATYPTAALWNTDHGAVFQIDGNFGITSGLTEMLIQSQTGTIYILPALPTNAFPTGSFNGLVARGGFEVAAWWENGLFTKATVLSKLGNDLTLRVQNGTAVAVNGTTYSGAIKTTAGQTFEITPA